MNENENMMIAQLERELQSLKPLAPDPLLCAQLERRMNTAAEAVPARPQQSRRESPNVVHFPAAIARHQWIPWAAAAAVVAVVTVPQVLRRPSDAVSANEPAKGSFATTPAVRPTGQQERLNFQPVRLDREFAGLQQEAIVLDPVRGPVRRYRVNFSEQQEFQDPSSGSVLRIQFPVQDVIEVPAGVQ